MEKKVIIIGGGGGGLLAARIAEEKLKNPEMEVVTIEEAKERGLTQSFKFEAPPMLDYNNLFQPPPTRKERRKQERANKKKR